MDLINDGRSDLKLTVEIVLKDDNGKIPGDIKITRKLGVTSDYLFLNGSRITRKELSFLMEICGLPFNTPYFILTHSLLKVLVEPTPENRLKPFVDCIGLCVSRTATFLDHKFRSMEEMQSTIQEFQVILDRFNTEEVDNAAAKLREYKALVKERSLLKISLYSLMISKFEKLVEKESDLVSRQRQNAQEYAQNLHELQSLISSTKLSHENCMHEVISSQLVLSDLQAESETLLKDKTRLGLKIVDVEEQLLIYSRDVSREETEHARFDPVLARPKKSDLEQQRKEVAHNFAQEKEKVEVLREELNKKNEELHNLLLRRGCREKFSTVEELMQWVNSEINTINKQYEDNVAAIKGCSTCIEEIKKETLHCKGQIKVVDQECENRQHVLEQGRRVKQEIGNLHNELNELHRREHVAVNELDTLMKNLKTKKTELVMKVGNSVFHGLESVRQVLEGCDFSGSSSSEQPDRCFGAIIQNMKCNPSLNLAIDAAAGSRLLAQIVSTDTFATAIMKNINSLKLPGSVTFFPLNRIIPPQIRSSPRNDAVPLINHLEFPKAVENVMTYLFGQFMLCRDLEVATQVAAEMGCPCVTMDGDRVNNSGSLAGGFIDPKRTTMTLFKAFELAETAYRDHVTSLESIMHSIAEKRSEIDSAMSHIQFLQRKNRWSECSMDKRTLSKKLESLNNEAKRLEEQLKQLDCANKKLLSNRQALQSVQDEPTGAQLHAIEVLNKDIFLLSKELNARNTSLITLEGKLRTIDSELACAEEVVALKATDADKLKILRQKLADYRTRDQITRSRLAVVEEKMSHLSSKIASNKSQVVKLESELDELKKNRRLMHGHDGASDVCDVRDKITNLKHKIEEFKCLRNQEMSGRNIKTIPPPTGLPLQEIRGQLKRLNEAISRMETTRNMSAAAIKRLKKILPLKENCALGEDEYNSLYVTFWELLPWVQKHVQCCLESVAELYSHFFSLMVEGGRGSMVLEPSTQDDKAVPFSGISLINQFSGGRNVRQMRLLSDGQRVVVLLSIVFAFMAKQKMGFCIMDEIDQSLSASRIHGLLQAMSEFEACRFLISSHNKTTISNGDHFYVLEFHKSTSMKSANRAEIMQLVEDYSSQSEKPSQQSDSSARSMSVASTN